ncbi:hypothetical protein [Acetobacter ghanensis]|uniref:Uncharacterized protein n=1 Tax=Acetobacter ghanensis TaxID=431306 RepID=A0A0U5F4A9_9PROT|nr:hypothetical protein [Acetobacter ghanensis]GBQ48447.1 hypothetical protein AA18895_1341 [Acetobacter ghanensis DSM 18895]CEF54922.1 hypothetical protein AGA_1051 [Acetobacter ghanensis]
MQAISTWGLHQPRPDIGAIGICAGAGYTVNAVNIGSMFRNGWDNFIRSIDALPLIEARSNARTTDAEGRGDATMPLAR